MKRYKVTGQAVAFGIGERLGLSKQQFDARRAYVELEVTKGDLCIVVVRQLQTFKVGETIGLDKRPKRLAQNLIDPTEKPAKQEAERNDAGDTKDGEEAGPEDEPSTEDKSDAGPEQEKPKEEAADASAGPTPSRRKR